MKTRSLHETRLYINRQIKATTAEASKASKQYMRDYSFGNCIAPFFVLWHKQPVRPSLPKLDTSVDDSRCLQFPTHYYFAILMIKKVSKSGKMTPALSTYSSSLLEAKSNDIISITSTFRCLNLPFELRQFVYMNLIEYRHPADIASLSCVSIGFSSRIWANSSHSLVLCSCLASRISAT